MLENVIITNLSNGCILARAGERANTFFRRLRGLLGRKGLHQGEALVLCPCNSVHCIGMRFVIDVIFLDRFGQVIHLIEQMKPGSISPIIRQARYVIELPAGQISRSQTMVGHILKLREY